MIPYMILSFSPILIKLAIESYTRVSVDANRNSKKLFCYVVGILLFTMYALKNQYVGSADSSHYYANWERLSRLNFQQFLQYTSTTSMEKGYLFTTWCLSHLFPSGQFTFVFSGLLYAISVMWFVYNNSDDVLISTEAFICLGLFGFMMQGLRQSIAMSICLLSIGLVKKRKLIPFALVIFLASLFHQTAIVFSITYFLYGIKLNAKTGLIAMLAGGFIIAISGRIVSRANDIFDREYTMVVSSGGFVATTIYVVITLMGLLAASPYLSSEKKETTYERDITFFWFMCSLGCIIYIMRYTAAHASQRISFYFMYSQMILLPNSLAIFTKDSRKIIRPIIVVLCILLNMYRLPREGFIPYLFFWQ